MKKSYKRHPKDSSWLRKVYKSFEPVRNEASKKYGDQELDKMIDEAVEAVRHQPAGSTLLAAFGSIAPTQKPEDFRQLRNQFELGVAKEEVQVKLGQRSGYG